MTLNLWQQFQALIYLKIEKPYFVFKFQVLALCISFSLSGRGGQETFCLLTWLTHLVSETKPPGHRKSLPSEKVHFLLIP